MLIQVIYFSQTMYLGEIFRQIFQYPHSMLYLRIRC